NLTADQTLFDRVHGRGLLSVDELLGENVVVYTLPKDRGRILHPHLPPDPHSGRGVPPPVLEDRCFIDGLGPALDVTGEVVKRGIRKASPPRPHGVMPRAPTCADRRAKAVGGDTVHVLSKIRERADGLRFNV